MEGKPYQEIKISEVNTTYDVGYTYHSNLMCQNYDLWITGIEEKNGRVTLTPNQGAGFEFYSSDPDRVIALAQMMIAFAKMAKENNQKNLDTANAS